jgi:8-oxo-dGTP pyrophosphatase MutT (NUDIX family)
MNEAPSLFPVDRLDLSFAPKPWDFASEKRAEIDAYFASLQQAKPEIWNGRVLLLHHQLVNDRVFKGDYLETDYASFAAWRAWGRPHAGVRNCFGAAAVVAGDGAVLLGVMGEHTHNAGLIYFPCGTPDPGDIVGGRVDLDLSIWRELKEETGLDAGELTAEVGWTTVVDGALISQIKVLRSTAPAEVLRARVLDHLAPETQPELADVRVVRGPGDFDMAMPRFVTTFLTHYFGGGLLANGATVA